MIRSRSTSMGGRSMSRMRRMTERVWVVLVRVKKSMRQGGVVVVCVGGERSWR
jgi:hypothetical protein